MQGRFVGVRAGAASGAWWVLLVWSGMHPHDRFTWWLEVAPIFIGVPALIPALSAAPPHSAGLYSDLGSTAAS